MMFEVMFVNLELFFELLASPNTNILEFGLSLPRIKSFGRAKKELQINRFWQFLQKEKSKLMTE